LKGASRVSGGSDEAQVHLRVSPARVPLQHGLPLAAGVLRAPQGVEGEARLHGRVEPVGAVALDTVELAQRAVRKPRLAQRDPEPQPDVVEIGATVEGLAVGLDRLSRFADLAVGVAERGLQVGELAPGGGVQRARRRGRPRAGVLGDLARALVVALVFVEARQRQACLGVVGVDAQSLRRSSSTPSM
jgi:hypothetical protein